MRKYKKIVVFLLLISILLPSSVFANSNTGSLEKLKEKIITLDDYRMFESEIKSEYVATEAMTEGGIRLTVAYNLSDVEGETTIIFVADENLNILFSGLIDSNEQYSRITDFNLKTTEFIDVVVLSYNDCYTDRCTADRARSASDPAVKACNTIVGQACKPVLAIPGYGAIAFAMCRAYVFIDCKFSSSRICTDYQRVPFCEY